jgi:hypothetical protein
MGAETGLLDLIAPGVGTAVGLASSVIGGIEAGNERKKMDQYLNTQNQDNENFYNKNYYSDYTQISDTQALMKNLRDNMTRTNKIANQTATITGATPEAQAVQKEQSNKVITDTTSRVAAQGQAWKDNIQNQYLQRKNQIGNEQYNAMAGNAQGYEALMGNGIKQIGNSVSGLTNTLANSGQRSSDQTAVDNINRIDAGADAPTLIPQPSYGVKVTQDDPTDPTGGPKTKS